MRDQVRLIAYADRVGGSLRGLREVLDGPLAGVFGGVHVLPFYLPYDGADAGFDPDDHLAVDPRLGTWDDVVALARGHDVTADLIVNHVSDRSEAFRDRDPGMFLTYDKVFPHGATADDLLCITRPRPGLPFTRRRLAAGRGCCGPPSPRTRSTSTWTTPPRAHTCRACSAAWRSAE